MADNGLLPRQSRTEAKMAEKLAKNIVELASLSEIVQNV
jgi:hypothetical protein